MSDRVSFLSYSDIHHDEYKNGLTGEDVEAIEEEFTQKCIEREVDFWIFGGDRFVSRNPWDVSRFRADKAWRKRNGIGIPGVVIPGNHDQWTKNPYGGHSMSHIGLFPGDFNNIHVIEKAGSLSLFTPKGVQVTFSGLPAGQAVPAWAFGYGWNILLFHGMVKGSYYQNGVKAEEGLEPSELDDPTFDLILGGDNHAYQKLLGFKHCSLAYYIGAPMQHNWGDAGSERGFFWCALETLPTGHTVFSCEQIKSHHPRFLKCETRITDPKELGAYIEFSRKDWKDSIVSLSLQGTSEALKDLSTYDLSQKFKQETKARMVTVKLQFDLDRTVIASNPAVQRTDADEWEDFLKIQGAPVIGQLDPEKLKKLGLDFIQSCS